MSDKTVKTVRTGVRKICTQYGVKYTAKWHGLFESIPFSQLQLHMRLYQLRASLIVRINR